LPASAKRKTIHDVARQARVSIKTVSRVINEEPNVTAGTRRRVLGAVAALRYHPSLSARSLAGRRSRLIALVYDNPSANYIVPVQNGAIARCRDEGFRLFVQPCDSKAPDFVNEVIALVDQARVDGLVLTAPVSESRKLIRELDRRKVPFVQIAPNDLHHPAPYTFMDDEGAAREMTEYLIDLGHRRIGFIKGHPDHHATGVRLRGYRGALERNGIRFCVGLTQPGAFNFDSGAAAARRLMTLRDPPTAIFASNDDMAAGVLMVAHELSISIPARLSVAGFDDTYIATATWPRLTTVHQPMFELAFTATDLLFKVLKKGHAPKSVRLQHRLVRRESTGTAPTRNSQDNSRRDP